MPGIAGASAALAGYDTPHRVVIVGVVDLPFFKTASAWLLPALLFGGWQLSGFSIWSAASRSPSPSAAPYPTGDFNGDGTGGDRPNAPASYVSNVRMGPDPVHEGNLHRRPISQGRRREQTATWDATPFEVPASPKPICNSRRTSNSASGSTRNCRFDAFNAFNRVNLNNPNLDLTSNNFGRVYQRASRSPLPGGTADRVLIGSIRPLHDYSAAPVLLQVRRRARDLSEPSLTFPKPIRDNE